MSVELYITGRRQGTFEDIQAAMVAVPNELRSRSDIEVSIQRIDTVRNSVGEFNAVKLITKCGCYKYMTTVASHVREIRLSITEIDNRYFYNGRSAIEPIKIEERVFRYEGGRDAAGKKVFREIDTVKQGEDPIETPVVIKQTKAIRKLR